MAPVYVRLSLPACRAGARLTFDVTLCPASLLLLLSPPSYKPAYISAYLGSFFQKSISAYLSIFEHIWGYFVIATEKFRDKTKKLRSLCTCARGGTESYSTVGPSYSTVLYHYGAFQKSTLGKTIGAFLRDKKLKQGRNFGQSYRLIEFTV